MDEHTFRLLEFDRLRAALSALAATHRGRELCEELAPVMDPHLVRRRQDETAEAVRLFRQGAGLPLGGIHDLREALRRAAIGVALQPGELLDVADTLRGTRRLRGHLADRRAGAPLLWDIAQAIGQHREVEERIRAAITAEAEVADEASPQLQRIRRAMRRAEGRIRDRLEALIRSADAPRLLQDPIVTIRDGRFVVPVKQECRHQVPGVVHDVSGSGATVFVEPMAVVELNNELRALAALEREEVMRILRELTSLVAADADAIERSCSAAAELDCIAARARLAVEQDAIQPALNRDGRLDLRRARHPLLRGEVVPLDVHLGRDFDTLVVTGPNTGGKTVALKTIGLLQLMAQAGLHVPAAPGTELSIFPGIYADIGDEQSIEQSLSTFSAHMTNIVRILAEAAAAPSRATDGAFPGCLVLLDELGAGTDPTEGAALGMAILERLHSLGARTAATTHYGRLKAFAYTQPRAANASVEFDAETLRPTYRLLIGLPGRSNAFHIAARLGLPREVVERARAHLRADDAEVDRLIEGIEASRAGMERAEEEARRSRAVAAELRREYEWRLAELERRERETLERARAEARDLVSGARRELAEAIREVRAARAAAAQQEQEEAIRLARERLAAVRRRATEPAFASPPGEAPSTVRAGETVEIVTLGKTGRVLAAPGPDGTVLVQAGILRVQARLADLRRLGEGADPAGAAAAGGPRPWHLSTSSIRRGVEAGARAAARGSTEIDLRGMTVEEAIAAADKFLDDAVLTGLVQVRIIHGKGTGALRQAIGEFLRRHPHVASHRLGGAGEGGDGVTIAALC